MIDVANSGGGRFGRWWHRARVGLPGSRIAFAVWIVVATLVVVPILYRATAEVGPGRVRASVHPAWSGTTRLAVPPLGSVSADTHRAPVAVQLELRQVDLLSVLDRPVGSAGTESPEAAVDQLRQEVSDDLPAALVRMVVWLAITAIVVGAVAALAFPGHRSLARLVGGASLGLVTMTVLVAPVAIAFDPERFEANPVLSGPVESAPELLQRVGSLDTRFGSVSSRTNVLASKLAGLYSSVVTDEIERSEGEVVLLHVSDLHLNSVGLALARDLARSFDVDALVDTGDITSFGFAPEAGFVELLRGFEVPYIVVAGNHDSASVRRQLAASDDVVYLDGESVEVGDVKVTGVADPTETALREFPNEVLDRAYRDQWPDIRRLVAEEQPDLLLVHNPVMAQPVVGEVPVIAAGHLHRTTLQVRCPERPTTTTSGNEACDDPTTLAVVGSSGATGLGDLLVEADQPYRFQLLRFDDRRLVAVDDIELAGAGGNFELTRHLLANESVTDDELTNDVHEPSRQEVEADQPERFTTSTNSTTSTTAPP